MQLNIFGNIRFPEKIKKVFFPLIYVLLPIFIYIFSRNQITSAFNLHATIILLIALISYVSFKGKSKIKPANTALITVATLLYIVASTGWFYSPFFFTLYLTSIVLAFLFEYHISLLFTLTIVTLFSINIGEVDLTYDFLVVLSLLSVIPVSLFLRKYYLSLKEQQKEILVLKTNMKSSLSNVDDLLSNKISNFSVNVRQSLNNIKQYSYTVEKTKDDSKKSKYYERIINSCENAIKMLNEFEKNTTGETIKQNQ